MNAPEAGDQQVRARIQQFIYLGNHVCMLTEVAGQGSFMVKLSPAKMDSSWKPGSEVRLSWQPQRLRALDVMIQ
ncbi:polyamine ABC transporter ATPase [Erwinia tracheiphila PSU-1]|nr:polyamine ABC transporter ATPase [Erwinia tracheiphila PSU-1]